MSEIVGLVLENAGLVMTLMGVLWLVSVRARDVSIVDPYWSIASLVVLLNSVRHGGWSAGRVVLVVVVAAWALRLWAYLTWRARGKPEDARYQAFRRRYGAGYWWISFFQVFVLQGVLALVVSAPLVAGGLAPAPDGLSLGDLVGGLLAAIGVGVEAVADAQMAAYKRAPHGPVMDRGLWGWSRHPNYLGELGVTWGVYLCVLDAPWGWATVVGPIVMTWLLLRVSGVTMLEAHLSKRSEAYAAYVARVPALLPRWRR